MDYKSPGGGSPALRHQLKILKEFLTGFDFLRMKPNKTIISGLPPETHVEIMTEAGKQYAVYLHGGKPAHLTIDLPAGTYQVQWHETLTGKIAASETYSHAGGLETLNVPPYAEDIALSLRATKE